VSSAPGLSLQDVSISYDGVPAVRGVSLDLREGHVLAVLGPSGSGKSTLLRAVAGLEPLSAGRIAWRGQDLGGVPTHRRGFALMFQDGQLFTHLTVAGNVGYALRLRRRPRMPARRITERVGELLELVGLDGYGDRLPSTLSGGERQRVALARSLAVEPRLLLLDEPLSALDTGLRERLVGDLRLILARSGTTALMVTHDQEEAFALADRLAVMREGRLVQQGDVGALWRAPVDPATALFLGYARVLSGPAAQRVAAAAGLRDRPDVIAVRRSALEATPEGVPGALRGVVVSVRATPEQIRLVVDVEGVGEVDAVASSGRLLGPGARIGLNVEGSRLAPVGTLR